MSIDIQHKRSDIFDLLKKLNPAAQPAWGKMSAQHVVEHLAFSVSISNGKGPQKQYTEQPEANAIKEKVIYTAAELQPGTKNPILGDEPPPLKYPDLQTAIMQLKTELDDFDKFYAENPDAKMIQPRMGPMNHKEWTTLHNKHITHHFKQFGLI